VIRSTDVITAHLKSRFNGLVRGQAKHEIEVTITGRRDLDRLARSLDRHGNHDLANTVRSAKSFSTRVTPEWFELYRRAQS
jgi:hypothetical protein